MPRQPRHLDMNHCKHPLLWTDNILVYFLKEEKKSSWIMQSVRITLKNEGERPL